MGLIFETFARDLLFAVAILVAIAWYKVNRRYGYWERKGIPFVKPVFPFGNFKETYLQRKSFGEASVEMYAMGDEPVLGLWSAMKPILLIRDPEIAQHILVKDFNSFSDRGFYHDEERDPMSIHLFSIKVDKWRQMRGTLSPSFTVGKIRATFPTMLASGKSLNTFVDKVASREDTIEVRELLAQYTTNIISSVAFGIEIDCIGNPDEPLRKMGRKVFESSLRNGVRQGIMFIYPEMMSWLGIRWLDSDVEEFVLRIVRQNIEYREKNNVIRNDYFQLLLQLRNTGSITEGDDFTTTLSSEEKLFTVEQCAAHTFLFFMAGFETSSSAMAFALYLLAKNRECLHRVHREIDDVLAKHNGQITYESMGEMKYLDLCIDETLRLYAPGPMLNRQTTEPWTIPNTNITIDKGTAIIIPVLGYNRDPKYWPEPDRFWPERFSPAELTNDTFVTRPYIPFGDGPRYCIGVRLGKLMTKMGLLVMLQNYNYELAGTSKLPMTLDPSLFITTPAKGIHLKITHRKADSS